MMRTLHLLDQPGETGQTPTLKLSVDTACATAGDQNKHAWLLIGGQPIYDAARAVGLDDSRVRLEPRPEGVRRFLPGAMRRIKRVLEQADRVVCWTEGATQIAASLSCAHAKPAYSEVGINPTTKRVIDRAAEALDNKDTSMREALRQRWGVGPDTFVMALLADRPEQVDAREPLLAMAFTYEMLRSCKAQRRDVRLLCHPASRRRLDAAELAELLGFPAMLLQEAELLEPWYALRGCDIAIAPCPDLAPLSLMWASAMGLPILASAVPKLPGLDGLKSVRMTQGPAGKHLAHGMTTWVLEQSPAERVLI